ncbi:SUMO-interacting motif-containing protein 1 [Amphiprion ocellaris]|uniref:SUMO-interacting motif-containing protein 1 n=1 Tax=Amphiprion ocellaris TaxID=80972 RepID=A0A3Q1AQ83_AMPOC|nr:SUMO-interacting motif-containing protein 1 [Amphiprion ocellaris]
MEDVITVSSDESDVEIVGCYNKVAADPLPLSAVRIDVGAVNVRIPPPYIDLSDPRWAPPQLKLCKRQNSSGVAVVDLTESNANGTEQETENLPPDYYQYNKEGININQISNKQDSNLQKNSLRDCSVSAPQQDCGKLKPKRRRMNFQTQQQKESSEVDAPNNTPAVKLTRLPFLETHVMELEKSKCSVQLTEDCTQMSLCFKQQNNNSERPDCTSDSRTTIASDASQMESSFNESPSPSEHIPTEGTPEWQSDNETYREDIGNDSPVFLWQGGSDGEDLNEESRSLDFRAVSSEDRLFVCPVTLKKLMAGSAQALTGEDDELFETSVVLCRQSLSLVYSTIDENYTEGTLQLLSDLLQPGYYPPKDITSHLLRGILLDPKCSYHLCVQAFNLLMRTQRHHMADKTTIPWDWELLTSVMSSQRHQCEVVRMLLEYIVQTLEDDFQAKSCTSALHHSIAKATLSCDQQFPRVRDVIKWLFSAIIKSTELEESKEATRERNEQIRMVSIFQRMLSLALEVDRSPALNSAKLSQELFDMLISNMPLRAHRMLLLDSLQSKLLRCKLLEYLLDYSCPLKISLPMSLSLLLHFLKNCTLAPDPTDGDDRWQRWEELVHLLWMLLLSYNKAMKGYLCRSFAEQKGSVGTSVYKPDDMVWKPAVREAVEAFLSRSQADIGQALPLHVEESLTYLQDHLLDVCQC